MLKRRRFKQEVGRWCVERACSAVFPPHSPSLWVSVCLRESNRGVWWGLLTDEVVIGRGSQDVSKPLTCPLALSTPLSPHIDHPATHHWSGKPGTSAPLRHTLRFSSLSFALCVCVCVWRRETDDASACVGGGCKCVWLSTCALTRVLLCGLSLWMLDKPPGLGGHTHSQTPFIKHAKGQRNLKACCYIILPIIQIDSTFPPLCCV